MSELEDFKSRIEILESAVEMLEQRLYSVMEEQRLEPYELELSDEDAQKIKDWVNGTGL